MYSLIRPSAETIKEFLDHQSSLPFSYTDVGATRTMPAHVRPSLVDRYVIHHSRIQLGNGQRIFERAKGALTRWEMFNLYWIRIYSPDTRPKIGSSVAILIRALGIWALNAARIVYVIDESGEIDKFGFACGTLPDHAESGEERFTVEWNHEDDTVWYDLTSFSRLNQWPSRLGFPYIRALQKKFGRESLQTMVSSCSGRCPEMQQAILFNQEHDHSESF